jgi:hypothetical protein
MAIGQQLFVSFDTLNLPLDKGFFYHPNPIFNFMLTVIPIGLVVRLLGAHLLVTLLLWVALLFLEKPRNKLLFPALS